MNTLAIRNRFPVLAAALLGALVILGFTRTYYLRAWFELPPLTRAAHIHGVLWTLWLVLHFTQARLIAAHRVDLHKKLGIAGAVLGVILVITSIDFAVGAAAAGHAPPGRNPLQFLSISFGSSVVFGTLFASALLMRGRREWHKRLMLLASMVLLLPGVGRLDGLLNQYTGFPRTILPAVVTCAFVAWACVNDWRKRGSVHAAYIYGGAFLIAAIPIRVSTGYTDAWMVFAKWATAP